MIAVCLLAYTGATAQSHSAIYIYNNLKGDHVLIRTDHGRAYFVTYYLTEQGRSCFIVKNGSDIRYFDMRECYENSPVNDGYVVYDMQMLGHDCYFCGTKWYFTGNIIYMYDGSMILEKDSVGFFGKFNVDDVLSGAGTYEILKVAKTKTLTKLAVFSGGATAVGVSDSMFHSCLVELHETGVMGGVMNYETNVLHSNIPEEVFMDVVHTATKSTTVSRYGNPQMNNPYRYYFGLRTGSPMNFLGTNNGIYNYNSYNVFGSQAAGFTGVDPVCLSSVNTGDGVTVSYLMSTVPQVEGKIISYRIDVPGLQTTEIQYNMDNYRYKRIREAKFNMPLNYYTRMAMLLEDRDGRSVLRFPYWNISMSYTDTILFNDTETIQSIAPFQFALNTLELAMGGFYRDNDKKILELRNHDIHGGGGFWTNYSCLPTMTGLWGVRENMITPVLDNRILHSYDYNEKLVSKLYDFRSHKVTPESLCEQ